MMTYHVPQNGSEDYYALDLLNSILSEGESSRLYNSIVDNQQLALEVGSMYMEAFDPTLFFFYGIANDGVTAAQLEKADS
jgi:zinc protease